MYDIPMTREEDGTLVFCGKGHARDYGVDEKDFPSRMFCTIIQVGSVPHNVRSREKFFKALYFDLSIKALEENFSRKSPQSLKKTS